ncbi:MAG: DUF6444 domain-containing protein [Candidatus Electrothrix sp. YB6]
MKNLQDDIKALKALAEQLPERIDRLENKNAELRRRLGLNSSNSDKPPSNDGYRKRLPFPAFRKRENVRTAVIKGIKEIR